MNRQEVEAFHEKAMERVRTTPPPPNQKFKPGTRVRIADDLGPFMRHFPNGRDAAVLFTYAHAYGGDDVSIYALDVDGLGFNAWYHDSQLTAVGE